MFGMEVGRPLECAIFGVRRAERSGDGAFWLFLALVFHICVGSIFILASITLFIMTLISEQR